MNDSSDSFPPAPWWPPGPPPTNFSNFGEQSLGSVPPGPPPLVRQDSCCGADHSPLLELEPRGQQPVAKAEGSPTAILIGCLVAIILLLLLIIALMLWRLHWRRLLSKVGGALRCGRGTVCVGGDGCTGSVRSIGLGLISEIPLSRVSMACETRARESLEGTFKEAGPSRAG